MILFLDTTSDAYLIALATREGELLHSKRIIRDERIGDRVFRAVAIFLKGEKPTTIIAMIGPGRFSGIRHGIAIANTLAFAWRILLIGIEKREGETPKALIRRAIRQKNSSALLVPRYSRALSITLSASRFD